MSNTSIQHNSAVETGKPVIRLLHKDPFKDLTGDKIEKSTKGRRALMKFRSKMQDSSLVEFWRDPLRLRVQVVFGLQDAQTRKPASGWISLKDEHLQTLLHENSALQSENAAIRSALVDLYRAKQELEDAEREIALASGGGANGDPVAAAKRAAKAEQIAAIARNFARGFLGNIRGYDLVVLVCQSMSLQ